MLTIQVIGNLGSNPEEKTTQGGTRLCRFSIASNKKIKGEKVTTWCNVTVFDEHKIDFIMQYVAKGTKLFIEGEPAARAYEVEGEARASLDVVLSYGSKVEICSSDPSAAPGAASTQADTAKSQEIEAEFEDELDDIPF